MAQRENMLALDAIRRAGGDRRETAAKHKAQQEEASAIAGEAEAAVQQLEARVGAKYLLCEGLPAVMLGILLWGAALCDVWHAVLVAL